MSFGIYLVGVILFIAGVAWGLSVAGVPGVYIGVAALIMLGLGILTGVTRTRSRDHS
ncbi:MAG: hypothetical protein REI94_09705 [Moraxellaceae bacterium]|nr:hypothetical protein [Moraxellaceae bacterium]